MKTNFFLHIFVWGVLSIVIWVDDAQAYLDPGTASMLFQSVVAAVVGGFFLIKTYWSKLKNLFSRNKDSQPELGKDHADE